MDEIKPGGRLATCISEMKRLRKESVEDKNPNEPKVLPILSLTSIHPLTRSKVVNIQSPHRIVQQLPHRRRSCIVRIRVCSSRCVSGTAICAHRITLNPLNHRSSRFRFRLSIPLWRFRRVAKRRISDRRRFSRCPNSSPIPLANHASPYLRRF